MTRTQNVLAGLLLLQLVLILLVHSPFADARGSEESHALLPELEAITASRLQFDGSDDRSLTLERRDGTWVLDEIGGFPADGEKIDDLIERLQALQVRRPIVSSGRYHDAFEISDGENQGRVRVFGSSDSEPEVELILGNSPNYRALHVRRADEDEVYEVRGLASYDVTAEAPFWAEKQLVDVPEDQLVGIRLTNASGSFELTRGDDGSWSVAGAGDPAAAPLDPDKVDELLRVARSVRIDRPVGPIDEAAHGLGDAAAVVELRRRKAAAGTNDEPAAEDAVEVLTYRIGSEVADKDSQRYVSRDGFGFTGTIWESSIAKLLEQTAADLAASDS